MAEGVTLEEQAEAAKDFMEGLLEAYGYEASVETRVLDEDTIEVAANGGELGLLVGPRGSPWPRCRMSPDRWFSTASRQGPIESWSTSAATGNVGWRPCRSSPSRSQTRFWNLGESGLWSQCRRPTGRWSTTR